MGGRQMMARDRTRRHLTLLFFFLLCLSPVEVYAQVPTAKFDASPSQGPAPLLVIFTDKSTS